MLFNLTSSLIDTYRTQNPSQKNKILKKLMYVDALPETSAAGNLEYLSIRIRKNVSWLFSLRMGPPKQIWISSFGSLYSLSGSYLEDGKKRVKILSMVTLGLHFNWGAIPFYVEPTHKQLDMWCTNSRDVCSWSPLHMRSLWGLVLRSCRRHTSSLPLRENPSRKKWL